MCYAMEKGTSGFGKTQCTQVVKTIWVQRILLIFTFVSLIVKAIIERTQSIVNAFWCLLLSYPFLTRWNSTDAKRVYCSGGCAALRRLRKQPPHFPPGQARTQGARLTDFCGAAAPQHRRGAPASRVWGRHSPTSSRPGGQMSGAKFGPRVNTCSYWGQILPMMTEIAVKCI